MCIRDRNRELLDRKVEEITGWIGSELTRSEVEEKLERISGIQTERISELADLCKYTYIDQATWNTADALNLSLIHIWGYILSWKKGKWSPRRHRFPY